MLESGVNTCSRCSANVMAFSLSLFAQLLSAFLTGGIDIWGLLSFFVTFQIVCSSLQSYSVQKLYPSNLLRRYVVFVLVCYKQACHQCSLTSAICFVLCVFRLPDHVYGEEYYLFSFFLLFGWMLNTTLLPVLRW
jgi:hypothetical protein